MRRPDSVFRSINFCSLGCFFFLVDTTDLCRQRSIVSTPWYCVDTVVMCGHCSIVWTLQYCADTVVLRGQRSII
jgi:hypothetical protein